MTPLSLSLRPVDVRVLAISVLVFALITADVVVGGFLSSLDTDLRDVVQPRPADAPSCMSVVAALGDIGVAAAFLGIAGLVAAHARWRLWPLLLAVGNFVAVEALVYAAKAAVGRPGPGVLADTTGYPGYFPSGHSATAAVSTGTVVFLLLVSGWAGVQMARASTAAVAAGVLVGGVTAVRAVLGDFHWATDGLAGLALAALVLTTGFALVRATVGSAVPMSTAPSRPQGR